MDSGRLPWWVAAGQSVRAPGGSPRFVRRNSKSTGRRLKFLIFHSVRNMSLARSATRPNAGRRTGIVHVACLHCVGLSPSMFANHNLVCAAVVHWYILKYRSSPLLGQAIRPSLRRARKIAFDYKVGIQTESSDVAYSFFKHFPKVPTIDLLDV